MCLHFWMYWIILQKSTEEKTCVSNKYESVTMSVSVKCFLISRIQLVASSLSCYLGLLNASQKPLDLVWLGAFFILSLQHRQLAHTLYILHFICHFTTKQLIVSQPCTTAICSCLLALSILSQSSLYFQWSQSPKFTVLCISAKVSQGSRRANNLSGWYILEFSKMSSFWLSQGKLICSMTQTEPMFI